MSDPKNIVLVTVDALRYDRVGYSGTGRGLTPALDGLVSRGIVFDNLFTQAVETPVSHASLFTGCFPRIDGLHAVFSRKHVRRELETIPSRLQASGYSTAGFISAYALDRNRGFARGFDHYGDKLRDPDPFYPFHYGHALIAFEALKRVPLRVFKEMPLAKRRFGAETMDAAMAWLDGVDTTKPFFMFCHLFDTHCEYYSPEGFRKYEVRSNKTTLRQFETGKRELTSEARRQIEEQYDLSVRYSDDLIGRLLDRLRSLPTDRDTIVIVMADHGEGLGDHGYMLHGCELYEEEVRVPCVIASLGDDIEPSRVERLTRTVDLAPTMLRLAGAAPFECDGTDAMADTGEPRISFTETRHTYLEAKWLRALRSDRFKYIYDSRGREELYDLALDRNETVNVIESERNRADQLLSWLRNEVGIE